MKQTKRTTKKKQNRKKKKREICVTRFEFNCLFPYCSCISHYYHYLNGFALFGLVIRNLNFIFLHHRYHYWFCMNQMLTCATWYMFHTCIAYGFIYNVVVFNSFTRIVWLYHLKIQFGPWYQNQIKLFVVWQ